MPNDHKAIYEQVDIQTSFGIYPCMKLTQPDSSRDHAVLFTWGGGGLLNTWKSQLGMAIKLGRDANVPVYYPIYPLATEHSLLDTMEMIVETYRKLLEDYKADNISVIGVSSGGSQALDFITYINEYRPEMEKPGKVICVSPGCVPITEEEKNGWKYWRTVMPWSRRPSYTRSNPSAVAGENIRTGSSILLLETIMG